MQDDELLRYSRHILLSGFDVAGQEKLLHAKVLVLGAGGLGCPLAMYLAASGVGSVLLADHDVVELSNLQRQIGHGTVDIGRSKTDSLADTLSALNPFTNVECIQERLSGELLEDVVSRVDVVADCSDNFATRIAVNLACLRQGKPLVSGAAIRYEGQLSVFNLTPSSPCYACLYGAAAHDDEATCSENGVLSPLVGVVGSLMATEVVKIIAGIGQCLDGSLLLCDLKDMEWRKLTLVRDPGCFVCGGGNVRDV